MPLKPCSLCGIPTMRSIRVDGHNQPYCLACKIAVRTCSILHTEVYDVTEKNLNNMKRETWLAEANVRLQRAFMHEYREAHPNVAKQVFECPNCGHSISPAPYTIPKKCWWCGKSFPPDDEWEVRKGFRHLHLGLRRAEAHAAKCRAKLRQAMNKSEAWMEEQLGQNSLTADTEWVRKYLNGEDP